MKTHGVLLGLLALGLVGPASAADDKAVKGKTVEVPYRLTNTMHVLVRAKINGKGPFNFIIDTGAPALFVATAVAKKLGVEPDKNLWGTFDRFELEGGLVIPKAKGRIETPFQLEGMNGLGLAGAELHGIIGYNLLAQYRIVFDFTRDKMTWTPLNYTPPAPQGLMSKGSAPGGLDALGSMMKLMGSFLGKKAEAQVKPRGFLGVGLADVNGGIEVKEVLANSPAARAGLKAGDRITRFQGKAVQSRQQMEKVAAGLAAGQSARIQLSRAGTVQEITVKLGEGF
jgi:hypothetical protein